MTVDPFAQLQAVNDALAELTAVRGLAVDAMAALDREGDELAELAERIDTSLAAARALAVTS